MRRIVIFCLALLAGSIMSCDKLDLIQINSSGDNFESLEQNDLFAIASSSSEKVKLESYFSFDTETKYCSDGSSYTNYVSSTVNVWAQHDEQSNYTTISTDTTNKILIKGMSPCNEEPGAPDTSQYSPYEPKLTSSMPSGGFANNFTIDALEYCNQSYFLSDPQALVKLRELYETVTNIGFDFPYYGAHYNEKVQGAMFRFFTDFYIGNETMTALIFNVKTQLNFYTLRDKAFLKGYGHKFDPYPYDPTYPLDLLAVNMYYYNAGEMQLVDL